MVDYKQGKIYKLCNNVDEKIYVGSTCGTLRLRKSGHKIKSKQEPNRIIYEHLNNVGWNNVEIILIEDFECESKSELHRRERYWIELLKPVLNKAVPTRTFKEYYNDNKEEILINVKKYTLDNKDKVRDCKKKYRLANKDKLKLINHEYRKKNKEQIKVKGAEYYEKDKEQIAMKVAEYRAKNCDKIQLQTQEKIICECGSTICRPCLPRHKKTQKHILYVSKLNN